ncbi:hypothetical protein OBRU01_17786 [Operophtera brumata]|uniref:THAP-type domain-containing protein n=1 Tax=Operophtera brumata TaxID=104452 RepID=A0A0L7KZW8_OPEBR|nr:hypothetical protein OBRU01_17786 [Operophtera brumata]
MYYKCCVPGCASLRENVRLHRFPKNKIRLELWLDFINDDALKFRMKRGIERDDLQVCHKHFEARFITEKSRLKTTAYPSLFLESDMLRGIPLNPPTGASVGTSVSTLLRNIAMQRKSSLITRIAKNNQSVQLLWLYLSFSILLSQSGTRACV